MSPSLFEKLLAKGFSATQICWSVFGEIEVPDTVSWKGVGVHTSEDNNDGKAKEN